MAIEVVKDKVSVAKDLAEDDVLWAINVALDIVNSINAEKEVGDDLIKFESGDSLKIASMLLEQYRAK